MRVREKYKNKLEGIARRLTEIRTLKAGQRPSFPAFEHSLLISVLETGIDFNPEIPDDDRPWVLRNGVSDAAQQQNLTTETLVVHLKAAERQYLQTPNKEFVLATSVGLRGVSRRSTERLNNVHLSFRRKLPVHFDRTGISERIPDSLAGAPQDIVQVLARVSARTPNAAFNQAQMALDLLRACWNFTLNRGHYRLFYLGDPRPTNPVLPGGLHTLHEPDGTLITDIFWVEPQPIRDRWIFVADEKWSDVEAQARKIRSFLRYIPYREDVEKALVRYVRALDDADARTSFYRVWSVLEYLTNAIGAYDALIDRLCFLVNDAERPLIRILLEHLRDVRNAVIHGDEARTNMPSYLEQARRFAEQLLIFHLTQGKRFGSRAEAAEYLDTPTDRVVLQKRMENYKRALKRK